MRFNRFSAVCLALLTPLACACAGRHGKNGPSHSVMPIGAALDQTSLNVLAEPPQSIEQADKAQPFKFKKEQGCRVLFAASINETEPCLFSLNTASGMTFANSEHPALERLASKAKRRHSVDVEQAGVVRKDAFVIYKADSVQFGGLQVKGVNFQLKYADIDDKDLFDRTVLDMCGGFGTSVLAPLVVSVDYPNSEISFLPPSLYVHASTPVASIAFSLSADKANVPYLELYFGGGKKAVFKLDTASSESLLLTDSTALDLDLSSDIDGIYSIAGVSVGGFQLGPQTAGRTMQKDNIAGCALFDKYRLVLDYPSRKLYLEPAQEKHDQSQGKPGQYDALRGANEPLVSPF